MQNTFRLICENDSWIAVKISFPWVPNYGVYAVTSISASLKSSCLRNDTQNFKFAILYMNTVCIAQWQFHSDSKSVSFLICMHAVKNIETTNRFQANTCKHFYRKNMTSFLYYVTATLRALFAWRATFMIEVPVVIDNFASKYNYNFVWLFLVSSILVHWLYALNKLIRLRWFCSLFLINHW